MKKLENNSRALCTFGCGVFPTRRKPKILFTGKETQEKLAHLRAENERLKEAIKNLQIIDRNRLVAVITRKSYDDLKALVEGE